MLTLLTNKISSLTLNIDINQQHDFIPKSESIKKYVDSEIERVINESLLEDRDVENISFKPASTFVLRPYFNDSNSYIDLGFKINYITARTTFTEESFYIFDLYDSYNDTNQKLISRNFVKMSKVATGASTDIRFETKKLSKEFINIYVPSYFIDTTDTFYLKISFFNSMDGNLRFFQCSNFEGDNLKNYFKIKINKNNKTYEILNGNILTTNPNIYKLSQVIEVEKEKRLANNNKKSNLIPKIKTNKTITTKGKFI